MSVAQTPTDKAIEFIERSKMTRVERDHRANGRHVLRADYYEFKAPYGRGLNEEALTIIADDIDVLPSVALQDYLARGGKLRKRRSAA